MQLVSDWQPGLLGHIAHQHYYVAIRRHPSNDVWSWALEWNHEVRAIGFCGNEALVDKLVAKMPDVPTYVMGRTPRGEIRSRFNVPLADTDDCLFSQAESTQSF